MSRDLIERCTCAEVWGEDPECALHGTATAWALENTLPSQWQELVAEMADVHKSTSETLEACRASLTATAEACAEHVLTITRLRAELSSLRGDGKPALWVYERHGYWPVRYMHDERTPGYLQGEDAADWTETPLYVHPTPDSDVIGRLVGALGPLRDIKAMSADIEDKRILRLHFSRDATDADRQAILAAVNARQVLASIPSTEGSASLNGGCSAAPR